MPTVHCPGCRRALNLPESASNATAICPLCRAEIVAGKVEPTSDVKVSPNSRIVVPNAAPVTPRWSLELDADHPPMPARADRVKSAQNWCQAAGVASLFQIGLGVPFSLMFALVEPMWGTASLFVFGVQFLASFGLLKMPAELNRLPVEVGFVRRIGDAAILLGSLSLLTALAYLGFLVDQVVNGTGDLAPLFALASCLSLTATVTAAGAAFVLRRFSMWAKVEQERSARIRDRPLAPADTSVDGGEPGPPLG